MQRQESAEAIRTVRKPLFLLSNLEVVHNAILTKVDCMIRDRAKAKWQLPILLC